MKIHCGIQKLTVAIFRPALVCWFLWPGHAMGQPAVTSAPPNVVIIYADDLGYGDLGCFGNQRIKTPNLDRMAAAGTKFTRFYVAEPVCSASRAALLTGCYAKRISIHGALGPKSATGIHDGETTIAELVKPRGYATGIVGKWHLGDREPFIPTRHGFDEWFGLPYSNDMWPRHPEHTQPDAAKDRRRSAYPELPLFDGEQVVNPAVTAADQSQLTTQYTERAVKFIERHRNGPFLLYVAHSMPHVPLFVSDRFKGKSAAGLYGDVIEELDWSVGEILAALRRHGLEERTLVIFASDNGPWLNYGNHAGSAGPLREGKGTCWEGGVRVPCLMRWPGRIPAGRVCEEPLMTIDLLPTVARLAGAPLPKHRIDGLDLWPVISGEPGAKNPHRAYFFYYAEGELQAMTSGRWKLQLPHSYRTLGGQPAGLDGKPAKYQTVKLERPQLFDLVNDPAETTDVATRYPTLMKELEGMVQEARDDLGDSLTSRQGAGVRQPGRL